MCHFYTYPLTSLLPSATGTVARKVRKYPVMQGRPNSLLKAALPIGPGVISDAYQSLEEEITLKHDVKTTSNMARS